MLAAGRDQHHPHWEERFTEPPTLTESASDVQRMKHRLKTVQGRALYALRKKTLEPVFGIIKSVMRFRQFLLRGLEAVRGVEVGHNGMEHQKNGSNGKINTQMKRRK